MANSMPEWAFRLRKLREHNELSQKEVSELLDIKQPTYCKYELGQRKPNITMLNKMADLFGAEQVRDIFIPAE